MYEPPAPDSDEVVARAKARLDASLEHLPVEHTEAAEALVDYVTKAQRSEARKLARHNFQAIQSWGKRSMALLILFIIFAIPIGIKTFSNSSDVVTLGHENRQRITDNEEIRTDSVRRSCEESNRRHQKAIPQIIGLIENGTPPKDPAERQAQREAIAALLPPHVKPTPVPPRGVPPTLPRPGTTEQPRPQPKTQAGRQALYGINAFIEIIAPAYNCDQRVQQFTQRPHG